MSKLLQHFCYIKTIVRSLSMYLHILHQHHQHAGSCVTRLAYWNTLVVGQHLSCTGHHPGRQGQCQYQTEHCCMQYHLQIHRLIKSACTSTLTFSALALTSSVCISQLLTDYSCINAAPAVITYCSPLVIDAHLHSTFILVGASHQTNISISTVATRSHCGKKKFCVCTQQF